MPRREEKRNLETIPVGSLRIIPLKGFMDMGHKIDQYLVKWRTEREHEHHSSLAFKGYQRDSYILDAKISRFGTGEAKGTNRSEVPISIFLLTSATTVLPILSAVTKTTCLPMIITRISSV